MNKQKNNAVSIGVAFRPVTRAKLNLIAAGMDRPVGWIVRQAVSSYLELGPDMDDYRARFPRLAANLDKEIQDAGGDVDEIYGLEQADPSNGEVSPGIQIVKSSSPVVQPSNQPASPAITEERV